VFTFFFLLIWYQNHNQKLENLLKVLNWKLKTEHKIVKPSSKVWTSKIQFFSRIYIVQNKFKPHSIDNILTELKTQVKFKPIPIWIKYINNISCNLKSNQIKSLFLNGRFFLSSFSSNSYWYYLYSGTSHCKIHIFLVLASTW